MTNIFSELKREKLYAYIICAIVIIIVYLSFNAASSLDIRYCEDGTNLNQCSHNNIGKFCDENANLINYCSSCGCQKNGNWYCYLDDSCLLCPEGTYLGKDKMCYKK
jgi:hypothetical protein